MDAKRKDLSLTLKRQRKSRKVCMVSRLEISTQHDLSSVFLVDLDSCKSWSDDHEFSPWYPVLRVRHGFSDAVCVLGSTLYVIDGCDRERNPKRGGNSSVFTCRFPSPAYDGGLSCLELEKPMLDEAPPMNCIKIHPRASPTPQGLILVFSCVINHPVYYTDDQTVADKCDFELYDPARQFWHKLPAIRGTDDQPFLIRNHAFIEDYVWLFTGIGIFRLHLGLLAIWEKMDCFCGVPLDDLPISGPAVSLIGAASGLVLDRFSICDLRSNRMFEFPDMPPPSHTSLLDDDGYGISRITHAFAVLDVVDDVKCNFCLLQSWSRIDSTYVCFVIDVYKCDLIAYKKEIQETNKEDEEVGYADPEFQMGGISRIPGVTIEKTFRLRILQGDNREMREPALFTAPH